MQKTLPVFKCSHKEKTARYFSPLKAALHLVLKVCSYKTSSCILDKRFSKMPSRDAVPRYEISPNTNSEMHLGETQRASESIIRPTRGIF